ncbi:hypothetical protein B9Z55_014198 [Caenorhabditis nigoni]|uniref:Transmembrane protein n=1 Tax=Caenorhabditis nigoni TaxID=1611254 RepID=A0A2G5U541_9PELO|nr:hypothetical protein B9Z55_014198 [Caenorhabditis nigoni]
MNEIPERRTDGEEIAVKFRLTASKLHIIAFFIPLSPLLFLFPFLIQIDFRSSIDPTSLKKQNIRRRRNACSSHETNRKIVSFE